MVLSYRCPDNNLHTQLGLFGLLWFIWHSVCANLHGVCHKKGRATCLYGNTTDYQTVKTCAEGLELCGGYEIPKPINISDTTGSCASCRRTAMHGEKLNGVCVKTKELDVNGEEQSSGTF